MKNFFKIDGIKILSKEEKKEVNGGVHVYCKPGHRRTCFFMVGGVEFAEPGYCIGNGRCAWF